MSDWIARTARTRTVTRADGEIRQPIPPRHAIGYDSMAACSWDASTWTHDCDDDWPDDVDRRLDGAYCLDCAAEIKAGATP